MLTHCRLEVVLCLVESAMLINICRGPINMLHCSHKVFSNVLQDLSASITVTKFCNNLNRFVFFLEPLTWRMIWKKKLFAFFLASKKKIIQTLYYTCENYHVLDEINLLVYFDGLLNVVVFVLQEGKYFTSHFKNSLNIVTH